MIILLTFVGIFITFFACPILYPLCGIHPGAVHDWGEDIIHDLVYELR